MSYHTVVPTADIPLQVSSAQTSSERRISPSWSIQQLRQKLERITGIPPGAQRITIQQSTGVSDKDTEETEIRAADEDTTTLTSFLLGPGSGGVRGIYVHDTRPANQQVPSLSSLNPNDDATATEKFALPDAVYEARADSVLAWKRREKLGRYDPGADTRRADSVAAHERVAREKGVQVGRRVCVGAGDDHAGGGGRRGTVRYLGPVPEIPGPPGAWWIGVELDEPTGRNDGSVAGGKRYFHTTTTTTKGDDGGGGGKRGVFVRPERVVVGDFPVLTDLEELEEI